MLKPQQSPYQVPAAIQFGILAVAIIYLVVGSLDQIWGTSSDLAHHYSLVARLSQLWSMPVGIDPSLGEMNIYPRNSHMMAALVGRIVGSPLLGLQIITLLSMLTVWVGLGAMITSLPRRAGLIGVALLAGALLLNRYFLRLEIYGTEDIVNFFYAQLVAQACMVGALYACLWMERHGTPALTRYGFMLVAIYGLAGMHLLPASQLTCILLAQIVLENGLRILRGGGARAWLPQAAIGMACMLAAVLVLVRHPAFGAMKEIAQNDGQLFLHVFTSTPLIVVLCLAVVAMSVLLLLNSVMLERRGSGQAFLAFKYIGLFGLSAAGLCLLQIILLKAGQGSEYAIKKHIFTLNSVFFVQLALLPACLAKLRGPHTGRGGIMYTGIALPLLSALAFWSITADQPYFSTARAVAMEHQLELRRDLLIPPVSGKYVYARDLPGMPPGMDYLMTLGIFGTPRTMNSLDVLGGNRPLSEPTLVGTIITNGHAPVAQMLDCLRPGSNSELAIVDGQCAMQEMFKGRKQIGFSDIDGAPECELKGLSQAESGGRWTDGATAAISCTVPQELKQRTLTIVANPFLSGTMTQRLRVSLNGGVEKEFRFESGKPSPAIVLALPEDGKNRLDVHLSLPNAVSPKQLGLSEDSRQLGVMVRSVEFN